MSNLLAQILFFYCLVISGCAIFAYTTLKLKNLCICIEWKLFSSQAVSLELPIVLDDFSLLFLFSVSVISASVYLFSSMYMSHEPFTARFHLLVISFVKSMMLLIVSPNIFSLMLGWDGLGVTSFLLVVYFQSKKSFNAGMITALTNRIGDVLLLMGISYLSVSLSWEFWTMSISSHFYLLIASFIFMIAAMTKSAQIPFSAWLPAAMAAPTPVSALVHSSTLVTAGVYLMVRFNLAISFKEFILVVGMMTMFMASIAALTETDMKKIVALSTLSQLGLMFVAIGANMANYAFFHLLVHAYFKAVMFIAVGNCIHMSSDYQDLRSLSLSPKAVWVSFAVVFLSNLSLMGMPFMSGFFSKDLIIEQMAEMEGSFVMFILMIGSVLFTALYALRFILLVFFSAQNLSTHVFNSEFSENFYSAVSVLGLLAVLGGSALAAHMGPNSLSTVMELKLGILALIFTGVVGMLSKAKLSNDQFSYSLGSMFSLPFISSPVASHVSSLESNMLFIADKSWTQYSVSISFCANTQTLNFMLMKDTQMYHMLVSVIVLISLFLAFYLFSICVHLFAK